MTRQGFCDFLLNMEFLVSSRSFLSNKDQRDQAYLKKVFLGTEGIYFVTKARESRKFSLDHYTDKLKLTFSQKIKDYTLSIMNEEFIK